VWKKIIIDKTCEVVDRHLRQLASLVGYCRTGMRWGELCELQWGDVDLKAGRLVVRRAFACGHVGPPKSGKDREVPLSPQTVAALTQHRHLRGDLVFCRPDGRRLAYHPTDEVLKRICKRAGLRRVRWHALRHTFASHLVMRGRSLKEVQELLGHSTIEMTMRYAHLSPGMKRDAVAILDSSTDQRHYSGTFGENGVLA
jgi:integrase